MPVEAKPLFRPDVLRPYLSGFQLSERVERLRDKLRHWAELLASDKADSFKEQELLPDFLTDFFVGLLGYTRPADGGDQYTISREKLVEVDGKFADAVLGQFTGKGENHVVAVEGKGPKDPLDRPFAGRKMSAVDQAYRYAINLPCDWIVVTSIRQTRLYHKGSDQYTFERFDTERLAADEALLRKFVFLLGAERIVPPTGRCHLYDLLAASEKVGRDLTKKFYVEYADMRQDAFEHLCQANPGIGRHDVLTATQKLLDRVLFIAFCEDRGLLPSDSIRRAFEHRDPYHPRPIWENFRGLFRSVNEGNSLLNIPAYNGGLFADDPVLDRMNVPDAVCGDFHQLGEYEYRPAAEVVDDAESDGDRRLIDVDILGHIFEQSITDLERLRNELDGLVPPVGPEKHKTRRKKEGAFYTPAFITRYIVEQALGGVLADRFEQLRQRHADAAKATARAALADPRVYDLDGLNKPQRDALVQFWELWQDELASIRLLDPACGSGAFLIEAFDQLYAAYQASNDRLKELREGERKLFDLDRHILQNNLYGVDLNAEAIEICKLSLWIKTAARGKVLTSLDHTIRVGNSVVADPAVDPRAFDWRAAFPEVFEPGGFDVVVGNPPYVRQELLTPIKPYLEQHYRTFHGMADLYVYFYELGLRVLKPAGRLSFVVTNKWMKAGYGEPLRRFFGESAWIESVVDFGHAKQIFEQADVFPSIIVARKPTEAPKPQTARVCAIPREQLRIDDLSVQIRTEGFEIPTDALSADQWSLEPLAVVDLMQKIERIGKPLTEFAGNRLYRGIVTGFNDAFLIDTPTKQRLIDADPRAAEIIKPYLRGQDIARWVPEWAGLWMIFTRRGIDIDRYPSVKQYLLQFRKRLAPKPRDWTGGDWSGRKAGSYQWFEIQDPVEYWQEFDKPKILYQVIQFHSRYAFDTAGLLGNDKTFFIPTGDLYLLAVLNSPLIWWRNWRVLTHLKDEALSPMGYMMESLPIARPDDTIRSQVEAAVEKIIEITTSLSHTRSAVLDWLRIEHDIAKPSQKLQIPTALDSDAFVAEVKKLRGRRHPLTAAGLRGLRDEHARTIAPARRLAAEAQTLEHRISDVVNQAYGLTPEEIALMWKTAPPRMPVPAPGHRGP